MTNINTFLEELNKRAKERHPDNKCDLVKQQTNPFTLTTEYVIMLTDNELTKDFFIVEKYNDGSWGFVRLII